MPCACAATLRARWPKRSRSGVEPQLGLRLLATSHSPDLLGSTAGGLGRPTDESQARPARRKPRATPNTIGGRLLFLACLRKNSRGGETGGPAAPRRLNPPPLPGPGSHRG